MSVTISAHALLRYAERALGIPVASERKRICASFGRTLCDPEILELMADQGLINVPALTGRLTTPAVLAAANMGECTVITPEGRIVVKNRIVVSFLARHMKHEHKANRPQDKMYFRRGKMTRNRCAA